MRRPRRKKMATARKEKKAKATPTCSKHYLFLSFGETPGLISTDGWNWKPETRPWCLQSSRGRTRWSPRRQPVTSKYGHWDHNCQLGDPIHISIQLCSSPSPQWPHSRWPTPPPSPSQRPKSEQPKQGEDDDSTCQVPPLSCEEWVSWGTWLWFYRLLHL